MSNTIPGIIVFLKIIFYEFEFVKCSNWLNYGLLVRKLNKLFSIEKCNYIYIREYFFDKPQKECAQRITGGLKLREKFLNMK